MKRLKVTSKITCEESGKENPWIGTYLPIGGEKRKVEGEEKCWDVEKVRVSKYEVGKMKWVAADMENPGMKLIGFKDAGYLKPYHNLCCSRFILPDDSRGHGSSACADALLKQMVRKNKIAIVHFWPVERSFVRVCALIPQLADEDLASGWHMIYLPYLDDIRDTNEIIKYALPKQNTQILNMLVKSELEAAR